MSEAMYRDLVEQVKDYAVFGIGVDGRITTWNEGALHVLGFDRTEFIGLEFESLFTPEDRAAGVPAHELEQAAADGSGNDDRWMMRKDGVRIWALGQTSSVRSPDGTLVGYTKVMRDRSDLRQIEDALRGAEGRYRTLVEAASDAIVTIDASSTIVLANAAAHRMFGFDPGELTGQRLTAIMPPGQRELHERGLQRYIVTGVRRLDWSAVEVVGMTKSGQTIPLEVSFGESRVAGHSFTAIIRDVSERRRAEQARSMQVAVLDSMSEGVSISDGQGFIVYTNASEDAMFGYAPGELIGKHVTVQNSYAPEENARVVEEVIDHIRSHGVWIGEWSNRRKDGTEFTTRARITALSIGGAPHWVCVQEDVTERKRAEAALHRQHELLETIFDTVESAIVVCDANGVLTHFNRKAREWHGLDSEPVAATEWPARYALHGPDGRTPLRTEQVPLYRALHGEDVVDAEITIVAPEKPARRLLCNARAMRRPDGQQLGAVVVMHDITHRQETEERLRQATRLESVGRLAGGVAHEVNNQMLVVLAAVEFIQRRRDVAAEVHADIVHIQTAARRTAAITSQLLAFGRRQMLQPRVLDLNAVIADLAPVLQRSAGENVRLLRHEAPELASVRADADQLGQVLLNLVLNARDAMPGGGVLTIETRNVVLTDRDAAAHPEEGLRPGPHVLLAVRDTGHGMDRETLSHVFEPFFTTKAVGEGTGLGLSTVYGIVKQSDGYVWATSEPGRGSTFEIYLPVVGMVPALPAAGSDSGIPTGTETVLVAEDESIVRAMVSRSLREQGYHVIESCDGESALAAAASFAGPIALALVDIVMPGMTGQEVAAALLEARPDLAVLFMSGHTGESDGERGLFADKGPFLQKPFAPDVLARRVREAIDERRRSGPTR